MASRISEEYKVLFDGVTDTITQLEGMVENLKHLQQKAEEIFISKEGEPEQED